MKQRAILLAVLAAVVIGLMVWLAAYVRLPLGMAVFANSSFTGQVFDLTMAVMLAFVLVIGLMRLVRPTMAPSPFLNFMSLGGPVLGLLAFLREASVIWFTVKMTHATGFHLIAPTLIEALAMPAIGLIAGALASAFAAPSAKA